MPPPPNLPIAKDSDIPKIKPSLPPAPAPSASIATPPLSQLPATKPASPAAPAPQQTSGVKSFIRTMEGDIKSLKQGAEPKGLEVTLPKPSVLPPLPQIQTAVPTAPKPATPAPTIRIGEAEKSQALPSIRPAPTAPTKVEPPKAIVIPPKKSGFLSKTLILAVIVIILAAGAAYWFFVLKQVPEPIETATFTPRPSVALDPLKTLKNLFSSNSEINIPNSASLSDLTPLNSAISGAVTDSQAKNVFITPKNESGESVKFSEFAKRFLANQTDPGSNSETLASSIYDKNFGLVSSLQDEKFNSKGQLLLNTPTERRLALIIEMSDLTRAQGLLSTWEQSLPSDIKNLFGLSAEADNYVFQDNIYREVPIRFVNFPTPDRSIDYAFVRSVNSKQYLVVSSSRTQMYGMIDTLLGF